MATSTIPVPDLTRYLVPADELEYPEYTFRIRAADDTGRRHLYQLISALLNTSGGVIKIDPGMPLDSKQYDKWQNRLKDQILKFMPEHIYNQCISLSEKSGDLFMLIRKSTVFITTESYMHTRGAESSTNYVGHWRDISAVVSQRVDGGIPTIFPQNTRYTYNNRCPVIESNNLEFKSYTCNTVDKLIERLGEPRTLKTLLGMANVSGGGEIVLGIKEHPSGHGNIIVGQELDVSEEADFEEKLAKLLEEDANGTKRVWGNPSVVPSEGTHWACDILHLGSPPYHCRPPCKSCPHRKRRCLICIRVAQVYGGVYERPPESFTVTDDGDVHMYEFSEWREKHQIAASSALPLQPLLSDKPITSTVKTAAAQASSSSGTSEQASSIFEDEMQISFREHSSHAELHGFIPEYSDHHLRKNTMFDMTRPLHCTPPAEDIEKLTNTLVMNQVNTELGHQKGFGIADRSLYNCIEHSLTPLKPQEHTLDLFTLTATAKAVLFIICASFSSNKCALIAYGMVLGRVMKQRILQNLTLTDNVPSLDFCCLFLDLSSGKYHNVSPAFYDKWLKNTFEPAGLISALGRVLTKVQTHFCDAVHHAAATSLSAEQTSTLLAIAGTRLNVIEGPPGCGKTMLAQHVCENRGKGKSAYISASVALNKRVQASGKVEAFLASESVDILSLLRGEIKGRVHIVIDDNHCYQHSSQTIAEICRQITTAGKYLYVFQDSRFQNYQLQESSQFVRHLISNYSNYTITTMKEIQRNSQIVGSFLKAQVKNLQQDDNLKCVSDIEGNDIHVKHITKLRERGPDNSLLTHIRDLISQPFSTSQWQCSYSDIAVLVDDSQGLEEVSMFKDVFEQFQPGSKIQSAEVYPVEGMIVDLLKNFSGLESKVIVFIMPKSSPIPQQDVRARLTKHMIAVASRGIHRVDILREDNLDKDLADRMNIDLYPHGKLKQVAEIRQVPVRVWTCEEGQTVLDVCWESEGEDAALLYTTWGIVRRVSVTGEPLPLSLDTTHMSERLSVSCTGDGEWAVVADYGSWTAYHREAPGVYRRHSNHLVDGYPLSVHVTPQGRLAVLVRKHNGYFLRLYRGVSDPGLVWEQPVSVSVSVPVSVSGPIPLPGRLSVSASGDILVCERDGVKEYRGTDGSHLTTVPHPAGLENPMAMCAAPSGRVWVGFEDGSVWLCDGTGGYKLIETGGPWVYSLALHGHRLAVATGRQGLQLYDVSGAAMIPRGKTPVQSGVSMMDNTSRSGGGSAGPEYSQIFYGRSGKLRE